MIRDGRIQLKIVLCKGKGAAVADRQRSYDENLPFLSDRSRQSPFAPFARMGVTVNPLCSVSVIANRLIIRLDILSGECNLAGM